MLVDSVRVTPEGALILDQDRYNQMVFTLYSHYIKDGNNFDKVDILALFIAELLGKVEILEDKLYDLERELERKTDK